MSETSNDKGKKFETLMIKLKTSDDRVQAFKV